jgi:hypothetical protein
MCNITCIYNEICHITNEIFQAQITICSITLVLKMVYSLEFEILGK